MENDNNKLKLITKVLIVRLKLNPVINSCGDTVSCSRRMVLSFVSV